MKNKLLFLFSLALIVGFSACTKTEYIEPDFPFRTVHATINSNEWRPNADETLWDVELSVPDIDARIVDHGTVLVDIAFNKDNNGEYIYEPLTTVFDGIAYRYDYSLKTLLIDVSAAGELIQIQRPPTAKLKIFLVDSESIN